LPHAFSSLHALANTEVVTQDYEVADVALNLRATRHAVSKELDEPAGLSLNFEEIIDAMVLDIGILRKHP
jgi:predicted transcriptional regulator